jgi:hypothetical protein
MFEMREERLAEILGAALNYIVKKNKIKDMDLDEFLIEELGVDDLELSSIYEYMEETR